MWLPVKRHHRSISYCKRLHVIFALSSSLLEGLQYARSNYTQNKSWLVNLLLTHLLWYFDISSTIWFQIVGHLSKRRCLLRRMIQYVQLSNVWGGQVLKAPQIKNGLNKGKSERRFTLALWKGWAWYIVYQYLKEHAKAIQTIQNF